MEHWKEIIDMNYAAGILDGDGSFSIMKHNGKYYPCIQLSNAFKGMSEWLHEKFGGSLRIKKPQKLHHKPLYVWSIRGLDGCRRAIERFKEYIILKSPQTDLMYEFVGERLSNGGFSEREGEQFSLGMKTLNREVLLRQDTLTYQTNMDSIYPGFWSYFSGILDTEGSFSIKKEKPHSGSVNIRYNPVIQLTMVPAECLNYIRDNFSMGSFCIPRASCTQKGYSYKMSVISKNECIILINNLLPYLRFKKQQALVILNFCQNYGSVKHCRGGIPKETIEFRESCYKQMRQLNNMPS